MGDQFVQFIDLLHQLAGGRPRIPGALHVAVHHTGNHLDIAGDLVGRRGLLLGRGGDLGELHGEVVDHGEDAGKRFAGAAGFRGSLIHLLHPFAHRSYRVTGLALDRLDHGVDLLGGPGGPLGKCSHLVGNDGEAPAGLTGARGLDGGVQGEEVGLVGDVLDGAGYGADLVGTLAETGNRGRGGHDALGDVLHELSAASDDRGTGVGLVGGPVGVFRGHEAVAGDVSRGGRHLFASRGYGRRLHGDVFRRGRHGVVGGTHQGNGVADQVGHREELVHRLVPVPHHVVEGGTDASDLPAGDVFHPAGEVACCGSLDRFRHVTQGAGFAAGNLPAQERRE